MTITYRIKDWAKHFETSEARRTKRMAWLALPNKHDGKSYRRLTRLDRAAEIYAAWILLLQVASKAPTRGVLASDDGPLSAIDLADATGFPEEIFTLAFAALVDPRIGWLEKTDTLEYPGQTEEYPGQKAKHPGQSGKSAGVPSRNAVLPAYRTGQDRTDRTGQGQAASAGEPIEETGGTDPEPKPITPTDRELIRPLAAWCRWRTSDAEAEQDNIAELAGLVRMHGAQVIATSAQAGHDSTGEKLWPNQVTEWLPQVVSEPAAPVQPGFTMEQMVEAYPVIGEAKALMDHHGWEWARTLWRYTPEQMPDQAAALKVLRTDITASEELVRKAKVSA